MKRLLLVCMVVATTLAGCSQNHFNVPAENISSRIRSLGVAPIFIDRDSDIRHPQKDQLLSLITETNRKNEQMFVRKLKTTGNYYTVAFLDGDAQNIFDRMLYRRETRDDAAIQYNKYFWKTDELKTYIQKNNLDAVMMIVVSGLTKKDKVTSFAQMKSKTSDYNYLIMTAQILDANGTVLWEYPNFRRRLLTYDPILNLEYPDFSEAEANLSTSANVKFRTIEGIRRILEQKRKDLLLRETQETEVYGKQFDEMLSLLKYSTDSDKPATQPAAEKPQAAPAPVQPVKAPETAPAPRVQPQAQPEPRPAAPPIETQTLPPAEEIAPAKGSTL